MIRAVIDTNVIFSGLLNSNGAPGMILSACLDEDRFQMVMSPQILDEVENVLLRPRIVRLHRLTEREVRAFVTRLAGASILVEGLTLVEAVARDPSDNMFLTAAIESGAEYVISGDNDILDVGSYEGVQMVSPRDFLELLQRSQ